MSRLPVALFAFVLLAACDLTTELEPASETVPLEQIIAIGVTPSAIVANGSAQALVHASIPAMASARVITFRTTGGVFVLTESRELKVRAERQGSDAANLVAEAQLRADTLSRAVIVSASIGDFTAYDTIQFTH